MIALIAEKPSVAKDIARIIGANKQEDGFVSGNGYMVTWALGHLIQLAMPDAYGVTGFRRESLPILPSGFQLIPRQIRSDKGYKPDPGVLKQIKVIRDVFSKCDKIIVATDAGREGELIFRYIYHYLDCHKPFVRLWISSLTDKAIRDGMENLQPGKLYDNLYMSAKSRSEADWLIGINASQALSVAAGRGVYSLGRVQTPTLAMICNRYFENKNFVPSKFWQVKVDSYHNGLDFSAMSVEKWQRQSDADNVCNAVKTDGSLIVKSVVKRTVNQEPPLLYDLTTLQKEANSKLNFSAEKTLGIAQSLYEKKVMSYPRTGSRYISEDVYEEMPGRISLLERYPRFAGYAAGLVGTTLNHRSVNDGKVTDHHALIITENLPSSLSDDERKIYEMVAGRMLEAFSGKCVKDVTSVVLSGAGNEFSVKGSTPVVNGWRDVFAELEKSDEDESQCLPDFREGDVLPVSGVALLEKQTKPKPLHTESSLLAAMEMAGKELEDEELKASMKDCGIGTPATRAAIIETLFTRQYIVREKKSLIPTEKGMAVFNIVRDKKIADVEMTGIWESALAKVESGVLDPDSFMRDIKSHTSKITDELLSVIFSYSEEGKSGNSGVKCPKCKKTDVVFFPKVVKCPDKDCGFILFRNVCGKALTDKQVSDLLVKGETGVIKGFKGKSGVIFDAALKLGNDYINTFSFPERKNKQSRK